MRGSRLAAGFVVALSGALIAGGAWASAFISPSFAHHPAPAHRVQARHDTRPRGRHRLSLHPRRRGGPVVLAFAGDVHFEGDLAARLAADPETALEPLVPLFAGADVVMLNLETAVGTSGKAQVKQYVFRAPPTAFRALRAAHVDVVTMANNHGMDYGADALEESLQAAEAESVVVVGAGRNATEAYRPYFVERKGERIAILGATQVLDGDPIETAWTATDEKSGLASAKHTALRRLLAAVRAARKRADIVVVFLHWGRELVACPTDDQRSLMHALVGAGADVIVGSHAHVLLGRGYAGRAFVHYGLGNFAFYANAPVTRRTGVLMVTVRGRDVVANSWHPAMISGGLPSPVPAERIEAAQDAADRLRSCTGLAASPASIGTP